MNGIEMLMLIVVIIWAAFGVVFHIEDKIAIQDKKIAAILELLKDKND